MNKKIIFLITAIIPLLFVPVFAQETETKIPVWIKVVAGAWYNGEITDSEYKDAQEFLIENGIFNVDRVSIQPVVQVQETNVESEKDKRLAFLTDELEKVSDKHAELRAIHQEYKDHYESFPDNETKDWYQQEFEKLKFQLNEIGTLKSRNASLEEENKHFGNNLNEANNKIAELEDKIRILEQ